MNWLWFIIFGHLGMCQLGRDGEGTLLVCRAMPLESLALSMRRLSVLHGRVILATRLIVGFCYATCMEILTIRIRTQPVVESDADGLLLTILDQLRDPLNTSPHCSFPHAC